MFNFKKKKKKKEKKLVFTLLESYWNFCNESVSEKIEICGKPFFSCKA